MVRRPIVLALGEAEAERLGVQGQQDSISKRRRRRTTKRERNKNFS
jgi:hypothetical protein